MSQRDVRDLQIVIGHPPSKAGDVMGAVKYLRKIERVLEGEGVSTAERRKLYKQRAKWSLRANGLDARWNTHGSKPGRPKKVSQPAASATAVPVLVEEDDDPLLAEIERKFGSGRRAQ